MKKDERPSIFKKDVFVESWISLQTRAYENLVKKGWGNPDQNNGELIALMHSELSEALEAIRVGNPPSDHIPEFTGLEEELADVVVRIMTFAAMRNLRIPQAVIAKMAFNASRPPKHGGKLF